ncbi:MAG: nucleotidyltransferase domain-containing protein [Armatimonadota bacterium]|nr:nucleotidyltransferase domain-containing protein [Armatimonadota bacterium]MDR7422714.1 nucleotidyltransferase domain-containing protein [Armatimonadota bacterium]MDR7454027.1 nucleotidyltransferase domain-containing protein [Armatimonadota bacterium]MDR7457430.1 nucleotidyltransferase domain-containing protein [Armatimonadota bacterium]MDR7497606.1 nucleotidyltransferase domain-containing protein [Armatimonadota bacterium]
MDTALLDRDPKLAEVVRRLVDAYQPERIYLFGSVARGESGPDSDYDLLVVVPDGVPQERRDSKRAYRALWGTATAADVIVWERSRFERRARVVCSLPATVLREGTLLYAA